MVALATLAALVAFLAGYHFWARRLGRRVFEDHEELVTPAHELEDGRDHVPTPRHILFGHHFTSISGAAPIVGPCVAAYWGWLPALAWVVFGTIFVGAVHDFGALVMSVREGGRSVADLAASTLGHRARLLFLCFVLMLVWLVLAVFAMAIAGLFVAQPTAVLPVHIEIVVAIAMGWLLYRKKAKALIPSLISLGLLYFFVYLGTLAPIRLVDLGLSADAARGTWIVWLFTYSAAASLAPVWFLLQPRDYINSHQLLVGLALLFAGLLVANPSFDAPAFRTETEGAPPLVPLLFVTIACGAISGFHGLVASGTTSKQLNSLRDARFVGYGAMLGEGSLALASTMAAVAGIGLVSACDLPSQGPVPDLSWAVYYSSWADAGANKAAAFVLGGGAFLESLGLPVSLARTVMAVLVISFAATTLDTATRIQRLILGELGRTLSWRPLTNPYFATAVAVLPAAALAFWELPHPQTGEIREAGWLLWPVFGASNQLLAAMILMVLALYFAMRRRPVLALVLPMLLTSSVAVAALIANLFDFYRDGNAPLVAIAALLLLLAVWMLVEGIAAACRLRRGEGTARTRDRNVGGGPPSALS